MNKFAPLDPQVHPGPPHNMSATHLLSLSTDKASWPDNLPAWLLKENADLLACSCCHRYFNCFFSEVQVPQSWKHADITRIFKSWQYILSSTSALAQYSCLDLNILSHCRVWISNKFILLEGYDSIWLQKVLSVCPHEIEPNIIIIIIIINIVINNTIIITIIV